MECRVLWRGWDWSSENLRWTVSSTVLWWSTKSTLPSSARTLSTSPRPSFSSPSVPSHHCPCWPALEVSPLLSSSGLPRRPSCCPPHLSSSQSWYKRQSWCERTAVHLPVATRQPPESQLMFGTCLPGDPPTSPLQYPITLPTALPIFYNNKYTKRRNLPHIVSAAYMHNNPLHFFHIQLWQRRHLFWQTKSVANIQGYLKTNICENKHRKNCVCCPGHCG